MSNVPAKRTQAIAADDAEVVEGEIVDDDFNPDRARLRQELHDRREQSMRDGQIDNSDLYAGSPMYFYCKFCGTCSDVLPEGYFLSQPKHICDACQTLIDLGWHDGQTPSFPRAGSTTHSRASVEPSER